ncbi:MAG: hypothetical protein JSU63_16645 [Phycisphaerales bacterium]|nr:MAG: hypothetical protein JSU63_16645 [Phycisphaerales bacterium]
MRHVALSGWILAGLMFSAGLLAGCVQEKRRIEPTVVPNILLGPMTIAVAPALNQSGATEFDPSRFADLMASELGQADGIKVIPVSRVLGVLAAQGVDRVESQSHARDVSILLGADAILVFAVTEYDPYDPPRIAISAQLYGSRPFRGSGALDPVALSKETGLASSATGQGPRGLLAESQRVFDASHDSVIEEVKEFAACRGGKVSPYGWRRFLVSQQDYIRFCCHATIRVLLNSGKEAHLADMTRER